MKKLLSLTLLVLLAVSSCKKEQGDPPLLPPAGSMIIDFSNFTDSKSGDIASLKGADNTNWGFAAFSAGVWNLIIGTTLAVPVWTFGITVDEDPVYIEDKTWEWTHSELLLGVKYTARLTGQIRNNDVLWKMHISQEGGFTDFLWFEGTSAFDAKSGQWILYKSYTEPDKMLQIDWEKDSESTGKVKYTYIKDNDEFKNSYIEYRLTTDSPFNAYYTIHFWNDNLDKFSDVLVEWNTTNHSGRVKGIDYIGDQTWHCWNNNLINTTCE